MGNKEIANTFNLLGKIMELHGENPFKIRSYANAYLTIRKLPTPLTEMTGAQMSELKGIGTAIVNKIQELISTGEMETLEKYKAKTPPGIVELLTLKGIGPKKIKLVWKELGVESAGELLYACEENRLVDVKGFGFKTQEDLKSQLQYVLSNSGKFLYANVVDHANELVKILNKMYPGQKLALTGQIKSCLPVVEAIEILCSFSPDLNFIINGAAIVDLKLMEGELYFHRCPVRFISCEDRDFFLDLVKTSSSAGFFDSLQIGQTDKTKWKSEEEVFLQASVNFIPAELRDNEKSLNCSTEELNSIVTGKDIRGVIHSHTTYSDGLNTILEMATISRDHGYMYIVISDHSKSAFYANGLQEDRLIQQWEEIDALNLDLEDFRIFKGIESDILYDGNLDYNEDVLQGFDLVIASVHSNLKMNEEKANQRLIAAIENPYTRILGHPTGRLLLSRKGYPINHKLIIDACASNGVVIELNANPHRLDLDWKWIEYALSKNVMIAINPDAHSISGIQDIRFGVCVARKAALPAKMCLNTMDLGTFEDWLSK